MKEASTGTTSGGCSESEIGKLHVEFLVEHDVFGLQVTVSNALLLRVENSLQHLLEVGAADCGSERSNRNEVKQFASIHEFKNHVGDFHIAVA